MPASTHEPVLALQIETLARMHDTNELPALWTIFTKIKSNLHNGDRLENMSWRLWYRSTHGDDVRLHKTTLTPLTVPMPEDVPRRSPLLAQTKSELVPTSLPMQSLMVKSSVKDLAPTSLPLKRTIRTNAESDSLPIQSLIRTDNSLPFSLPAAAPLAPAIPLTFSDIETEADTLTRPVKSCDITLASRLDSSTMTRETTRLDSRSMTRENALYTQMTRQPALQPALNPRLPARLDSSRTLSHPSPPRRSKSSSHHSSQSASPAHRAKFYVGADGSCSDYDSDYISDDCESDDCSDSDDSLSYTPAPLFYKVPMYDVGRRSLLSVGLRFKSSTSLKERTGTASPPIQPQDRQSEGDGLSESLRRNVQQDHARMFNTYILPRTAVECEESIPSVGLW
jgi:Fungal protein of unknown function (DUF1752)